MKLSNDKMAIRTRTGRVEIDVHMAAFGFCIKTYLKVNWNLTLITSFLHADFCVFFINSDKFLQIQIINVGFYK